MNRTAIIARGTVIVAAGLIAAACGIARAEVRVSRPPLAEAPALHVQPAPTGPWSLLGTIDPSVLNPGGDTYGDGFPGDAGREETLLAAWMRPASSWLMLAQWDESSWRQLAPLDTPGAIGVPDVEVLGLGWAVTWQQVGAVPWIAAVGVSADGQSGEPEHLIDGWLVDTAFLGDVQLVLSLDPDRQRHVLTAILWSVPSVPSPVEIVWVSEIHGGPPGDGWPGASTSTLGTEGLARLEGSADGAAGWSVTSPTGASRILVTPEGEVHRPIERAMRRSRVVLPARR